MAVIEYLEDGTKRVKLSPRREVPFYNDWLKVLLSRGCAYVEGRQPNKRTGIMEDIIVPRKLQEAVVQDGEVGIVCIGCGKPMFNEVHEGYRGYANSKAKMQVKLDTITIGGFIQVPVEESTGLKEITVSWQTRPVHRSGLGCADCRKVFAEIVEQTNETNKLRNAVATLLAHSNNGKITADGLKQVSQGYDSTRCSHGLPTYGCSVCNRNKGIKQTTATVKLPAPLIPFIDVFERDALGEVPE